MNGWNRGWRWRFWCAWGWKDDGQLQWRLDSFDSVIVLIPKPTNQFVWHNFHHNVLRIHFRKQPVCCVNKTPSNDSWAIFPRTLCKRSRHWSLSVFKSQQPEAAAATFGPIGIHPSRSLVLPWNRLNAVSVDGKDGTDIDFHARKKKGKDPTSWLAWHAWMCCWFDIIRPLKLQGAIWRESFLIFFAFFCKYTQALSQPWCKV